MSEREEAVATLLAAGLKAHAEEGRVAIKGGRGTTLLDGFLRVYYYPFVIVQAAGLYRALIAWKGETIKERYGSLTFVVQWVIRHYRQLP